MRAMCGKKVVDRKTTEEQMDMLGLKKTIDRLATENENYMIWTCAEEG